MDKSPDNLLTQWSRVVIGTLVAAGVRRVVISPGSRSTPLVAAIDKEPRLSAWVLIDERSAAFFALAQAKITGEPTVLVCTSGTAAAHYFPAVIEADESRTPLLVLSADRPRRLQGNRAAQTIDQTGLFGLKVRGFFELGEPLATEAAFLGLVRKTAQAVALSLAPHPGPVHINFPADKPLEPRPAQTEDERALEVTAEQSLARVTRITAPTTALSDSAALMADVLDILGDARRPVLSFGPRSPATKTDIAKLANLCVRTGWPILAEASSGLRMGAHVERSLIWDAADLAFRVAPDEELPDFVLHFGDPVTSGAANAYFGRARHLRRVVVSEHAHADPHNSAHLLVRASEGAVADVLCGGLPRASAEWGTHVRRLNARCWEAVSKELVADTAFGEAHAFVAVGGVLSDGDALLLGNSLPIRIADSVIGATAKRVHCVSQRGANGIDGLVSAAAGIASVTSAWTLAVVGDVTAVHDIGGLAALSKADGPVTVLVINNHGGRIFEQLPIAQASTALGQSLSNWITPHDYDIAKAGEVFGVRSMRAGSASELRLALGIARQHSGASWIEACVEESGARSWYARVQGALTGAA